MQSKKEKSKMHTLAGVWEDLSSTIALGDLRTQAFIVVGTNGDGHIWKTVSCMINSPSVS
jgi:hypothetical protein